MSCKARRKSNIHNNKELEGKKKPNTSNRNHCNL